MSLTMSCQNRKYLLRYYYIIIFIYSLGVIKTATCWKLVVLPLQMKGREPNLLDLRLRPRDVADGLLSSFRLKTE